MSQNANKLTHKSLCREGKKSSFVELLNLLPVECLPGISFFAEQLFGVGKEIDKNTRQYFTPQSSLSLFVTIPFIIYLHCQCCQCQMRSMGFKVSTNVSVREKEQ